MDDTKLGTQKFQDFQEGQWEFMQDFKSYWFTILENSRILQNFGFPGIPVKIHKILGKLMEFQSGSPSLHYRISNVVHGGVWIFSEIVHYNDALRFQ